MKFFLTVFLKMSVGRYRGIRQRSKRRGRRRKSSKSPRRSGRRYSTRRSPRTYKGIDDRHYGMMQKPALRPRLRSPQTTPETTPESTPRSLGRKGTELNLHAPITQTAVNGNVAVTFRQAPEVYKTRTHILYVSTVDSKVWAFVYRISHNDVFTSMGVVFKGNIGDQTYHMYDMIVTPPIVMGTEWVFNGEMGGNVIEIGSEKATEINRLKGKMATVDVQDPNRIDYTQLLQLIKSAKSPLETSPEELASLIWRNRKPDQDYVTWGNIAENLQKLAMVQADIGSIESDFRPTSSVDLGIRESGEVVFGQYVLRKKKKTYVLNKVSSPRPGSPPRSPGRTPQHTPRSPKSDRSEPADMPVGGFVEL